MVVVDAEKKRRITQRCAVYPGSFDPITQGHVEIIRRIAEQFDQVIVLVSNSPQKQYLFTADERKFLVENSLPEIKNMKVEINDGLTVQYCKANGAQVIVRGLRAISDFEYEMTMANMNKKLDSTIETLLLFSSPECYFVSSRGVKEVARFKGNLGGLVPSNVILALQKKFNY